MKNMLASRYTDSGVFEQEQRTLFRRHWQLFCHVAQLKDHGDYVSGDIAGMAVMAIHGSDGKLRAFRGCSNPALETAIHFAVRTTTGYIKLQVCSNMHRGLERMNPFVPKTGRCRRLKLKSGAISFSSQLIQSPACQINWVQRLMNSPMYRWRTISL